MPESTGYLGPQPEEVESYDRTVRNPQSINCVGSVGRVPPQWEDFPDGGVNRPDHWVGGDEDYHRKGKAGCRFRSRSPQFPIRRSSSSWA